jgi:hypothetical protein
VTHAKDRPLAGNSEIVGNTRWETIGKRETHRAWGPDVINVGPIADDVGFDFIAVMDRPILRTSS